MLIVRYFTEIQIHLGNHDEADVAEFDELEQDDHGNRKRGKVLSISGTRGCSTSLSISCFLQYCVGLPKEDWLYGVADYTVRSKEEHESAMLAVGLLTFSPLPTLPLSLRGNGFVTLDVDIAYEDFRNRSRV